MVRNSRGLLGIGVSTAALAAASLVLPWFELSGRPRSTIDVIGSAGALEVIAGSTKLLVVLGWLMLPLLAAAGMLLAASGRDRLAAAIILPIGPLVLSIVLIGLAAGLSAAWGVWPAALSASVSLGCAIMVLVLIRRAESTSNG